MGQSLCRRDEAAKRPRTEHVPRRASESFRSRRSSSPPEPYDKGHEKGNRNDWKKYDDDDGGAAFAPPAYHSAYSTSSGKMSSCITLLQAARSLNVFLLRHLRITSCWDCAFFLLTVGNVVSNGACCMFLL